VFSFTTPPLDPVTTTLDKLAAGDINGDGVPDVVILARQTQDTKWSNRLTWTDAVVYMADTFGPVDINGDGETPDFAGTYTKTVISNDGFRTHLSRKSAAAVQVEVGAESASGAARRRHAARDHPAGREWHRCDR